MSRNINIPTQKIVVIPRGVDIEKFASESVSDKRIETLRWEWGIAGDSPPIIMLPGRITPLKGHKIFIRALSTIKKQEWAALVIGDHEENPRHFGYLLQFSKDLGVAERVKFAGHCDDMPAAYLISDVVVSATAAKPEAFCRVEVEVAAMARPVIATAHGGSMETVVPGQTGWFVNPLDPDSLSKAIEATISNKELCQKLG